MNQHAVVSKFSHVSQPAGIQDRRHAPATDKVPPVTPWK
jgi:hypothetical protein